MGAALRTGPRSVEVAVTSGSRSGWDVAALVGRRSPPLAAGVSHWHPEVFVSQAKDVDPTGEFVGHPGTQSRTLKQPLLNPLFKIRLRPGFSGCRPRVATKEMKPEHLDCCRRPGRRLRKDTTRRPSALIVGSGLGRWKPFLPSLLGALDRWECRNLGDTCDSEPESMHDSEMLLRHSLA